MVKDDTIILLGVVAVGGYALYKSNFFQGLGQISEGAGTAAAGLGGGISTAAQGAGGLIYETSQGVGSPFIILRSAAEQGVQFIEAGGEIITNKLRREAAQETARDIEIREPEVRERTSLIEGFKTDVTKILVSTPAATGAAFQDIFSGGAPALRNVVYSVGSSVAASPLVAPISAAISSASSAIRSVTSSSSSSSRQAAPLPAAAPTIDKQPAQPAAVVTLPSSTLRSVGTTALRVAAAPVVTIANIFSSINRALRK